MEKVESEATKRPWRLGQWHKDGTVAIHAEGASVFHLTPFGSSQAHAEANAALIVRAVNNHDSLLEACKAALESLEDYNVNPYMGSAYITDGREPQLQDILRSAIARAQGDDNGRNLEHV